MKRLKKMAVIALVVLALAGCTKSSMDNEMQPVVDGEEFDPAKFEEDEDETLPREENFLVEEDAEEETMYEWEQVKDETNALFADTDVYPQSVKMEFTADEPGMSIQLTWVLKNDTTDEQAMEYAADMVKKFNDIVAVQATDVESSSETSFGGLWDSFALKVQINKEDGSCLLEKSYPAGQTIDLKATESSGEGPEEVPEDVPKKL